MPKSRTYIWLTPILVVAGLLLIGVPGLWVYMSVTATSLHPDPRRAPSVTLSPAPPKWADAVERGRQIARTSLAERNLPGLSVAVGVGGDIVWAEGFGFADLENRVPVSPSHRFRIGTASIVLTSAAAGLLMEEGRLKLDNPIQSYVPEFPQKQWPVTVRQLMGHLAGIENDGGDEATLLGKHCEGPVDALRHFAGSALLFEPGTQFRYSSYGWILVSAAIEAAAREPFLMFMRERVLDPLGMRDTVAESAATPIPDRADSYFPRFAADPKYGLHPMRDVDYSCYAGASVFLSTPSDLARFGMAINNGKLLRPATVRVLQMPQRLAANDETGYGLGWDVETVALNGRPVNVAGHDGYALGGMVASLATFPEDQIAVSVMSNISYADTFSVAVKIGEAFAEQGRPARK